MKLQNLLQRSLRIYKRLFNLLVFQDVNISQNVHPTYDALLLGKLEDELKRVSSSLSKFYGGLVPSKYAERIDDARKIVNEIRKNS
jgi:hypothetical protein